MNEKFEWCLSLEHYKEFFKSDTILDDYEEPVILEIIPFDYPADREWEYSLSWYNPDTEESGEIRSINSSSLFSLCSCSWEVDY